MRESGQAQYVGCFGDEMNAELQSGKLKERGNFQDIRGWWSNIKSHLKKAK